MDTDECYPNAERVDENTMPVGVTRRTLFQGTAALGGSLVTGVALAGIAKATTSKPKLNVRTPSLTPPREQQVEMVPLSHSDLAMTGDKWAQNGFTWKGAPLWFYWGIIHQAFPGQTNPIQFVRAFTNGSEVGTMTHREWQPGLFRDGIDLGTEPGSYFSAPAGPAFSGPLDPGGYRQLTGNTPGQLPNLADPDNLGGPNERTYEMSGYNADGSSMLYRAGTRGHRIVDKSAGGNVILDIVSDYFPTTVAVTPPAPFSTYFVGGGVGKGSYRGKDVTFLTGFDRFMTSDAFVSVLGAPVYIAFVFSGIGEDGRREWGSTYLVGDSMNNFRSFGGYCRDGEEPICSHDVEADITWVRHAGDPTRVAPSGAVYRWKDLNSGKTVEIVCEATHSSRLKISSTGHTLDHVGCDWRATSGAERFVRSLGAWEFTVNKLSAVPISASIVPRSN